MANLINRALGIITRPQAEWAEIEGETATTQELYTGYVIIMAAIPAVIALIGSLLLTAMLAPMMGAFGGMGAARIALTPVISILSAVISYGVGLLMVFVLAQIINALAPSFDVEKDPAQAMKVAAYAPTPVWVASIANIVPVLGWLVVFAAAIYTIFVMHWGLKALMKPPEDKAVGYTAVVIIVGCVVAIVIGFIVNIPITIMTAAAVLAHHY